MEDTPLNDEIPCEIPDDIPDKIPEEGPDDIPDEIPDDTPDDMDVQLLLAMQKVCNNKRVPVDYEEMGRMVGMAYNGIPITGSAVQQHLAKTRSRRSKDGLWVPAPLRKGGNTHGTATHNSRRRNGHKNYPGPSSGNMGHYDDSNDDDDDDTDPDADPDASYDEARKTKRVKKEKDVKTEGVAKTEDGVKTEHSNAKVVKKEKSRNGQSKKSKTELAIKMEDADDKRHGSENNSTKRKRTQSCALQSPTGRNDTDDELVGLGASYMKLEGCTGNSIASFTTDSDDVADNDGNGGLVSATISETILPSRSFPSLIIHTVEDPFAPTAVQYSTEDWDSMANGLPSGMATGSISTGLGTVVDPGMGYESMNGLSNPYGFGSNYNSYQPLNAHNNIQLPLNNNGYENFGMAVPQIGNGYGNIGMVTPQNGSGHGNFGMTTPHSGSDYSTQFTPYDTPSGLEGSYPGLATSTPQIFPAAPFQSSYPSSSQTSAMGSMPPPPMLNYGQYSLPVTPSHPWDITNFGVYGNVMASPASTRINVSLGPGFPATPFHGLPDPVPATTIGIAAAAVATPAVGTAATTLSQSQVIASTCSNLG